MAWNKPANQQQAAQGMQKAGVSINRVPETRPSVDVRPYGGGGKEGELVFDIESRTWKTVNEDSGAMLTPVRTRNTSNANPHGLTASPASSLPPKSRAGTLSRGRRPATRGSTDSGSAGSQRPVASIDQFDVEKLSWGGRMKKRMGL